MTKKRRALRMAEIVVAHIRRADLFNSSALISYYLLLAVFPFAIVIGNLLPFLGINPVVAMEYINLLVPEAVRPVLEPVFLSLFTQGSGGMLSLGALVLLWSAGRAVNRIQYGLNRVYAVESKRGALGKRLFSTLFLLVFVLIIAAFILILSFGMSVLQYLGRVWAVFQTLAAYLHDLRWPVTLCFVFLALLLIYVVAPDTRVRFSQAAPGAVFATLGIIGLAQALALYLRIITRSLTSYGALSTVFIMMFWLNFSAMILLLGAVLNASIQQYREPGISRPSPVDRFLANPRGYVGKRIKRIASTLAGEEGPEKPEESTGTLPEEISQGQPPPEEEDNG